MVAYPLFKMLTSPPAVAAEIVRRFDFGCLDEHLPPIGAPPPSAQVLLSAVVTAMDMIQQQRFPEALRCALIATRTFVELCDAGRHSESILALKACLELIRGRTGGLPLHPLLGSLIGVIRYAEKGELPMFAHTDRVTLTAQTSGVYSELLHELVKIYRPLSQPDNSVGFLGMNDKAVLAHAIGDLNADGYHLFERKVPERTLTELVRYSLEAPADCFPHQAGEVGSGHVDLTNQAADGYQLNAQALLDCPAVQGLLADPSLLAVASNYLGCTPVLGMVVMRWSLPSGRAPSNDLAQYFHWDDDWIRWLKIFIYLTDVDSGAGPHLYIKGSHQPGKKPRELLDRGYARIPDEEIERFYSADEIVSVEAPRGTVFAGDTRCWHKGLNPTQKHRLLLQFNYADSFAMGPPPEGPLLVKRSHTEVFRRFVAQNRAVFPPPYFAMEDGALEGLR